MSDQNSIEGVKGIPEMYLHPEAKIQIDLDNTAEAYLKRGISKKNFMEFVLQVVEMMDRCMKNQLHANFNLKQIEVVDDHVVFKVYVGNSDLQMSDVKAYLKTLAYTAVFQGDDFLQTVYEYLSFMDQGEHLSMEEIHNKVYFWLTGKVQEQSPIQASQQTPVSQPFEQTVSQMIPQALASQVQPQALASQVQPQALTPQAQPQVSMPQAQPQASKPQAQPQVQAPQQQMFQQAPTPFQMDYQQLQQIPPAPMRTEAPHAPNMAPQPQPMQQARYSQEEYSQNGETGVLDPAFWTSIMGQSDEENPNRIRRQSRGATLLYLKTGEKITVDKASFVVGKGNEADYVMKDSAISRKHAEISCKNGHYFITDNGSTNGTYVNGKLVPQKVPIEIFQGDLLRFSTEEMKFQVV